MESRDRSEIALARELEAFNAAEWSVTCRRMQILVLRGLLDQACLALRQFAARNHPGMVHLDDHIASVAPVRISEALSRFGYTTWRSVRNAEDEDLMTIPGVHVGTVRQLRELVRQVERGRRMNIPVEPLDDLMED